MERFTGYSREDIQRLGWDRTLCPDAEQQEKVLRRLKSAGKGDDLYSEEWDITHADGGKRTLGISTSVLYREDGKAHVLAIVQDATKQRNLRDELEGDVREKADRLGELNEILTREVEVRKAAEEALRTANEALERKIQGHTQQLGEQARILEEKNSALKILLQLRDQDKQEVEETLAANMQHQFKPLLHEFRQGPLSETQTQALRRMEDLLQKITSGFVRKLTHFAADLTPTEMKIAGMIKDGLRTKEISARLHLAQSTIHFHRENLRKKLGLTGKRVNLQAYLQKFE
jgi:PAS domain S-box-containing protein